MKSGFLLSSNPNVSFLSEKPRESDETIGLRKYKYEDFDFNRTIGNGNFSTIWHVTLKYEPFSSYAIKSYNINDVTSKNQHVFVKQERSALLSLNSPGHDNVIRLIDTFRDKSNVYLIYEYAELELWELIKHCGTIFDDLGRHFVNQIIDGLEYIHSKGIVHRDLKCENIVISKNRLKIIDFGSSKDCNETKPADSDDLSGSKDIYNHRRSRKTLFFENYVGTPNFMDPHSLSNKDSGFKRDFWSLGCLIYQILCGRPPFYGSTEYFVLKRVTEFDLVFPDCINADAKNLIKLLLDRDEKNLPSFQSLRSHPFLNCSLDSVNFGTLQEQSKEWREICHQIGSILNSLTESRSPEMSLELKNKFDEHIRNLKDRAKHSNMHVMDRLIDLMFWSLEETKREIVNETIEADKWLS